MKPFSAMYYTRENKSRASLLVFMFVLTFSIYLAGLYISNIETIFEYCFDKTENIVRILPYQNDDNLKDFNDTIDMLRKEDGITLIQQGVLSNIYTNSIMGYEIGVVQFSFRNKEDFKLACDYMGIKIDKVAEGGNLSDGSAIMSSLQAKNRGLSLGDKLIVKDDEFLDKEYILSAITDEPGYGVYYISDTYNDNFLIFPASMNDSEFRSLISKLKSENKVRVFDNEYSMKEIDSQLKNLSVMYFFLIILVSIIMAITINAAFVGMYQYRQREFALYKAIGISRKRIWLKIVREVVLMDMFGVVIGFGITMMGIYLLNHLFLLERGLKLFYYNKMSLTGMLISNIIVIIPVTILQGTKLMKADICDY